MILHLRPLLLFNLEKFQLTIFGVHDGGGDGGGDVGDDDGGGDWDVGDGNDDSYVENDNLRG